MSLRGGRFLRRANVAFRRLPTGETQIIKLADMFNVKWSKAQKQHRQRFKEALIYAKAAMADENIRCIYETTAQELGKRPYRLAVSDYFRGRNFGQRTAIN